MQTLRGILNFTRVAELGSFAAAARDLGISSVAVSQNISRLEESLGVRLIARSTRALQLTNEGQAFWEQCKGPLDQLAIACKDVANDGKTTDGKVRATIVSPMAFQYLIPLLPLFYKEYPGIILELEMSEDSTALISKRFDVGIRVGALVDEAFVARPLGPMRLLICAAPSYLTEYGVPKALEDLQQHKNLLLQISGREQPQPFIVKKTGGQPQEVQLLTPPARFICNDFRALKQTCIDALGIAQLPQTMVLDALKSGALKTVLPQHMQDGWQLFIHYPSRKQLPARVRAFVDFCMEQFGGHADLKFDTETLSTSQSPQLQKKASR